MKIAILIIGTFFMGAMLWMYSARSRMVEGLTSGDTNTAGMGIVYQ